MRDVGAGVGLVVPTGYSFNLYGTCICHLICAMFIAQAMGIELIAGNQITLVVVSMLPSKGSAGVAGASFIALLATLTAFRQIPIEGAAIILGVDRFISEIRTATNMIGNGVATLVVARWEGEREDVRMHAALNQTSPVPRRKREGSCRGYRPVLPQASYAKLPRPVALPRECCFYEAFWRLGREHRPCALA
jgi:aerobic C4-dicarboxylate transport protein